MNECANVSATTRPPKDNAPTQPPSATVAKLSPSTNATAPRLHTSTPERPVHSLNVLRKNGWNALYPTQRARITVGMGTCGQAAGANAVMEELERSVQALSLSVDIVAVGCRGMCFAEPLVEAKVPGWPRAVYAHADKAFARRLAELLAQGHLPADKLLGWEQRDWAEGNDMWIPLTADGGLDDSLPGSSLEEHDFLRGQIRRVTSTWGRISPSSVEEYAAYGGYEALHRAVHGDIPAEKLLNEVEKSGLRGRGGAGFPTGRKWRLCACQADPVKYVVANGDEGDPGAYMDRTIMESDPHRLIEGMALAAYAIGAHHGYVFTRSEYPHAASLLETALDHARNYDILGDHVLGSDFTFDIEVLQSAGAYLCGEETACIAAMEGARPDPRPRPPYPTESGLHHHPTCICNVETYANIPSIALHGAKRFRQLGTEESPGTKIFSLAGSIERAGLVEVEMGTPLDRVVRDIAAPACGARARCIGNDSADGTQATAVAVQIGGPSGAILPLDLKGLTLDFEGLNAAGGIMGSGGLVVLGPESCVVDTVRYFLDFSARASCGSCKACREGLTEAAHIAQVLCEGTAPDNSIEQLETLARRIPRGSRCGLGKMATRPLSTALRYFRSTFEQHLRSFCTSCTCKALMHFEIVSENCPGCLCCLPSCPTGAIKGRFGKPFAINQDLCTKCWMCVAQCPYPALRALPGAAKPQASVKRVDAGGNTCEGTCATQRAGETTPSDAALRGAAHPREDKTACILCGRCVKACREKGASALCFVGTGAARRVCKPSFHRQTSCAECGACRQACPTGFISRVESQEIGLL